MWYACAGEAAATYYSHFHVLSFSHVASAWNDSSTHQINKLCHRRGRLWQQDGFDHIVRDDPALARIRRYIRDNGRHLPEGKSFYACGSLFQQQSPSSPPRPSAAPRVVRGVLARISIPGASHRAPPPS